MKHYFKNPSIDPAFESSLRQEVVTAFGQKNQSWLQRWQIWLPVSVSFAALSLFVLSSQTESAKLSNELITIEQELVVMEQQLLGDAAIDEAVEFIDL